MRLETIRAKVGATILDVFRPGWANEVTPSKLDLANCHVCVLGQLFGEYETGSEKLFGMRRETTPGGQRHGEGDVIDEAAINAGFYLPRGERFAGTASYSRLTDAWKREIAKRTDARS